MTTTTLAQHIEDHGLRVEGDETHMALAEAHAWLHAGDLSTHVFIRHLLGDGRVEHLINGEE